MAGDFNNDFNNDFSIQTDGGVVITVAIPRTLAEITDAEIALIHQTGDTDPEWDGIYIGGIRLSFLWHCENHTDHEVMSNRYGETNYG